MSASPWLDFYGSDLQGVYALIAAPAFFLLYRLRVGRPASALLPTAADFVDRYAVVCAVQTILDPLITGPLARALGLADGAGGTVIVLVFVLLGDFRVYLLVFALLAMAAGRSWTTALGRAAGWTLVVPLLAYPTNAIVRAFVGGLDDNSIWLIYEVAFAVVAWTLRERLLSPAARIDAAVRGYLNAVLLYVVLYYALWASADVLIQVARLDVGWALRLVPNQLYYAFWVPFVYWRFFRATKMIQTGSTGLNRMDRTKHQKPCLRT